MLGSSSICHHIFMESNVIHFKTKVCRFMLKLAIEFSRVLIVLVHTRFNEVYSAGYKEVQGGGLFFVVSLVEFICTCQTGR